MFRAVMKKKNKGSTLVEMMVCFALLGIFMSAAAVVIANITNVFFDAKGETKGRQVSNIIMSKIAGELEGAKVDPDDVFNIPVIYQDPSEAGNNSGFKIDFRDRTDTHIQLYAEDGELKVRYFAINPDKEDSDEEHYDEVIWTFDEAVYQGYKIESLRFVRANQGFAAGEADAAALEEFAYGSGDEDDEPEYPGNVIGVYLTLNSPQYGEFFAYKYVKMYNITDEEAKKMNIPIRTTKDYN